MQKHGGNKEHGFFIKRWIEDEIQSALLLKNDTLIGKLREDCKSW